MEQTAPSALSSTASSAVVIFPKAGKFGYKIDESGLKIYDYR